MIPRFLYLTLGVAVFAASAHAQESTAELKTAGYHLQKPSAFHAAPGARAPFWPIGWAPTAKGPAPVDAPVQEFTLKPDQFSVTSILLGSQSLAVINGRTYGEGEFIRVPRTARTPEGALVASSPALPPGVKIRVNRIADGQVVLQAGAQAISVPLRRPRLSDKKPGDEDLLTQAAGDR